MSFKQKASEVYSFN